MNEKPWIPETLLEGIGARLTEAGRRNAETGRIPAPVYRAPAAPSEEMPQVSEKVRLLIGDYALAQCVYAAAVEGKLPLIEQARALKDRDTTLAALLAGISRIEAERDAEHRAYAELSTRIVAESGVEVDAGGMTAIEAVSRLRAALSEARKDTERLDWLESHPHIEVTSARMVEAGDPSWLAHERRGNINDTEWHEVATAYSLREAIDAAFRLGGTDRKEENDG